MEAWEASRTSSAGFTQLAEVRSHEPQGTGVDLGVHLLLPFACWLVSQSSLH